MRLGNVSNDDFGFQTDLGMVVIGRYNAGKRNIPKKDEFLRFIWSFSPLELVADGVIVDIEKNIVPPRSAIKVHPGTEINVKAEHSKSIYVATLLKSEKELLDELSTKYTQFFESLSGVHRNEWDTVKDMGIDYVDFGERNSDRIYSQNGLLVAPASSKFKPNAATGWNLMYTRGSRSIGVALDMIDCVRPDEVPHFHKIMNEFYIADSGQIEIDNNGNKIGLKEGEVLVSSPFEKHMITNVLKPYKGATLQLPSIPGDKSF